MVSVIMRSKDSAATIGAALAALFAQRYRDVEVLLVDSGSTDATLAIAARWPVRVIHIRADEYVPGPVLNRAIAAARGELVVFQNSDVVPLAPDVLDRLVGAFADPAVQAAFCRQIPYPDASSWVRRDYAAAFPARGEAPAWLPLSLCMAAMRRSIWAARPFYGAAWGSEDVEWGRWARRAGHRIAYLPDAPVMHSHDYTLRQLYGRMFVEGEADAFMTGRAPAALRALRRAGAAATRDAIYCARRRDWRGLFAAPVRRAVYQLARWRGERLGARRLRTGDRDAGAGQRVEQARR
jgi:rhamnosyltransferase